MKLPQTSTSAPPNNGQPLFYVVDWLPPDFGAVGQYAVLFATEFAENGRHVELIGLTSGKPSISQQQFSGGGFLRITRIPASLYNKSNNLERLLWTLRTNARLMFKVVLNSRSHRAEVLFTGSPPFMLLFSFLPKLIRGAKLTYRITDFFPEVIAADAPKHSLLFDTLQRLIWMLRRKIDGFQVLGEDQRRLLLDGGISPERIVLKRDTSPVYISGREIPAQVPSGLDSGRVLLYSGNYGIAHEADTVVGGLLEHSRRHHGNSFSLWLNASGARADEVENRLRDTNIRVVRTSPAPLDMLPSILAAADVHLITLRPEFVGIVLPSKVYSCISSRRPILYVGPTSSDVHLLCSQAYNIRYEQVDPGDCAGFADALDRLASVSNKTKKSNE
jgi:hypothetical protein